MRQLDEKLVSVAPRALSNAEALAGQLETNSQEKATQIVGEVLKATQVPSLPRGKSEGDVSVYKNDFQALLASQPTVAGKQAATEALIEKAAKENNLALLRAVLGESSAIIRQAAGLDDIRRLSKSFQARLQAVGNDVHSPFAPPAAGFLSQQFDPTTALGSVAANPAHSIRAAVRSTRRVIGGAASSSLKFTVRSQGAPHTMPHPHGKTLMELSQELRELPTPKSPTLASLSAENALLRAFALELSRMIACRIFAR